MIKLTLPDGSVREAEAGTSILDVVKGMSNSLAKKALAASLDGEVVDLTTPVTKDAALRVLTFDDEGGRHALRHTAAHVMAQAVKRLYPESHVQLAIGPAIENGFYYDFDMEHQLTDADLRDIEKEMKKIVKENLPLVRREIPRAEHPKAHDDGQVPARQDAAAGRDSCAAGNDRRACSRGSSSA